LHFRNIKNSDVCRVWQQREQASRQKNPKSKVVRKHNSCDSSVHATVISNPSFDMKIPMQEL
jgi:hypothetical protein